MAQEELELTQWLFREITSKGFEQYEISNFGKYRSLHNLGYWEHKPYIGLGSGAVGFLENRRYYPSTSVDHYVQHPCEMTTEEITEDALLSEKLFLGFRSCVGVDPAFLTVKQKNQAEMLCQEGLLTYRDGHYFNPDFLLADEIALRVEGF
jgi:oxygen-independent coproporphyrinogen-3 oxidase